MEYEKTRYNVFFTRYGKHYLWNTLTGALIRLDQEATEYLNRSDFSDVAHDYFLKLEGEFMKLFGNDGPYLPESLYHAPRSRETTAGLNWINCFLKPGR